MNFILAGIFHLDAMLRDHIKAIGKLQITLQGLPKVVVPYQFHRTYHSHNIIFRNECNEGV